jgi:hypothetical protein
MGTSGKRKNAKNEGHQEWRPKHHQGEYNQNKEKDVVDPAQSVHGAE